MSSGISTCISLKDFKQALTPAWAMWQTHIHTLTHRQSYTKCTCIHTHQTTGNCWGRKIQGGWWVVMAADSVLHTQTNRLWQLPLRKTRGCFYFSFFFSSFFITACLTASAFYQTSIVYLCSVQSHLKWQTIRREPLPSHFPPFFYASSLVLSLLQRFFSSHIFFLLSYNDKWAINWRGVRLSPIDSQF